MRCRHYGFGRAGVRPRAGGGARSDGVGVIDRVNAIEAVVGELSPVPTAIDQTLCLLQLAVCVIQVLLAEDAGRSRDAGELADRTRTRVVRSGGCSLPRLHSGEHPAETREARGVTANLS